MAKAPDPGIDLHDHPWWFVSIVLWGGYTEQRALCREAPMFARIAEEVHQERVRLALTHLPDVTTRGVVEQRRTGSVRVMRLDECHTITDLHKRKCWTLVIGGPRRRRWEFYLPSGWMAEAQYDATVRAERRDLWGDIGASGEAPWVVADRLAD